MKNFDTSNFPPEQRDAVELALKTGCANFALNDVNYFIQRQENGFLISALGVRGENIGSSSTHFSGQHYALKVHHKFRGLGIGKVLFSTKQALDGILRKEWSGRYSRIFFLIKQGYIPVARIFLVHNDSTDRLLSAAETDTLIKNLHYFYHNRLVGEGVSDFCPYSVRMLYAPSQADKFLTKIQTSTN